METTAFEDAVIGYGKYCNKNNLTFDQPSENSSEIDGKYVHLRNRYRDLAKYEIATKKITV